MEHPDGSIESGASEMQELLERLDFKELLDEVERFARQSPVGLMVAAWAVGNASGRMFRQRVQGDVSHAQVGKVS